jgi:hypothetical protein
VLRNEGCFPQGAERATKGRPRASEAGPSCVANSDSS